MRWFSAYLKLTFLHAILHCFHYFWMTLSKICCTKHRNKIDVFVTINVLRGSNQYFTIKIFANLHTLRSAPFPETKYAGKGVNPPTEYLSSRSINRFTVAERGFVLFPPVGFMVIISDIVVDDMIEMKIQNNSNKDFLRADEYFNNKE